ALHLRSLLPGARCAGWHGPRAGHRQGNRGGARRAGPRRVPGREGEPLHGDPSPARGSRAVSRWRATALVILIVGCRRPTPSELLHKETSAERSLERADELSRDSHPREARALYEDVLRSHPDDTDAAHALYGLGRLAVAPGPQQDYRAARVSFERLLAKYPDC